MTANAPSPAVPADGSLPDRTARNANLTQNVIERSRAWSGLWAVAVGDVAIAGAAAWGVYTAGGSSSTGPTVTAILTSAFTAIGTMTTAYFGIRSMSNTVQNYKRSETGDTGNSP
jgi:hypothetical protein